MSNETGRNEVYIRRFPVPGERVPVSEGGRYFFRRNDGTQDQDVLYVTDDLSAEARVLQTGDTIPSPVTTTRRLAKRITSLYRQRSSPVLSRNPSGEQPRPAWPEGN